MSKQLVSQVDIDATAEQVWEVLTDLVAYPAWNPFIVSAVGAAEVGSKVTLRMQPVDARAVTLRPTVLEATRGHQLRWRGRLGVPGVFDAEHVFTITSRDGGGVTLTQAAGFTGMLVPFMAGSLDRHTLPAFVTMNEALKVRPKRRWRHTVADPLSPRARQVVAVARDLLEAEGSDALTMRRLAGQMGIRAPSLYKHVPHKAALEAAIIADGFLEAALAFEAATDGAADPLAALVDAYRRFAAGHPHVYRLMTAGPLPRDLLPPGLEARTAAPLLRATGSPARARAAWAFIHGMITLELDRRIPADGVTEQAWSSGIAAFHAP